jgi:hypothetical protein
MLGKLLFIIMAAGAIASALLVNRQQRIETFHEMTATHQRLLEHEATLWRLRSEIAGRCRPSEVRSAIDRLKLEWIAIPARPEPPAAPPVDVPAARFVHRPSSPTTSTDGVAQTDNTDLSG